MRWPDLTRPPWWPWPSLPRRLFRRFVFRREVLVCLVRELDAPVRRWRVPAGIVLRWLTAADLDGLHPDLAPSRAAFADNFAAGLECHAALADGRVVAVCWFARDAAQDPKRQRFRFRCDEIYTFSLFVAPAYRGRALAAAVQTPAWSDLRARDPEGRYRWLVRLVSLENERALKLHRHMGFRPDGRGRYDFRLFHWRVTRAFAASAPPMRGAAERRIGAWEHGR
ncbi:MAG: GNAT family N-acetyltransferase [Rhodospirillales bacterium]|nr:GNAT family N-acetyltransferase [Rhodospirillales bacterium]